jgi:hypothetical protein
MIEAIPSINAFSPFVTIPASLLQSLQEAISTLQSEVAALREERDQDRQELASLRATVTALETRQEEDTNRLCLDICQDRRRLATLEQRPSTAPAPIAPPRGEKTIDRIAKLKDFLKARGGGATFQECERLLAIHPNQMTKLVSQLDKRSYEVFTRAGDDRQRVLRLKAQIVSRER